MNIRTALALACVVLCSPSMAAECRLDQATYIEPQSGAVLAFHPKTQEHGIMTSGVFTLILPNIEPNFDGEITWNAGRNARPDGLVRQACQPDSETPDACALWVGYAYAVSNSAVGLVDDDAMAAPPAILLAGFGRSLLWRDDFLTANPGVSAFDLFELSDCSAT